jgi:hypothetical protein
MEQHEEGIEMFQKACLVLIVVLLTAILLSQRSPQGVHAQIGIDYKVVNAELFHTPDGKEVQGGPNATYYSTQDALNEYGKNGWQLVTAFYENHNVNDTTPRVLHLIFMKR